MNYQDRIAIREMYKNIDTDFYNPYPMDWVKIFSPIEYMMWCDIRNYPMRMWPQYPIGKYFADFANVENKIVIECDGKQWHNPENDAKRDAEMIADGWTVYRAPGIECNKIVEREDYYEDNEKLQKYWSELYQSSSGLVKAIHHFHYPSRYAMDEDEERLAYRCLMAHQATGIYVKPKIKIERGFE